MPSGYRYDYFDVPPEIYSAFRASTSKGRFFNTRIRDRFDYEQIGDGAPAA